jgi:protein TonB
MKTIVPAVLAGGMSIAMLAGLGGCAGIPTEWSGIPPADAGAHPRRIEPATVASPPAVAPAGLEDYKTQVARHVAGRNPERAYTGTLPPLLPAVVVVQITVDRDGQLADVAVQRSRNPTASAIALASVERSAPLPPPQQLARASGRLTFSETFLFADSERYQLRSLAAPQARE